MAWTGGGSAAVVSAGSATGSPGFSFVSTRTGTVFTLTDVGAWSGHQRALKLRASKGMTRTPSLTTGVGARGARRGLARAARGQKPPAAAPRGQGSHAYWPHMTRADRGGKDLAFAEAIGFCQYRPTFMDWDGTAPTLTALEICPLCARLLHSPQRRTPSIFKNFPHRTQHSRLKPPSRTDARSSRSPSSSTRSPFASPLSVRAKML